MHLFPQFLLTFIRKPANKIWSAQWKPGNVQNYRAHLPDPGRHGVSAWGAVVGVDDNDRDDDWSDDKYHCKQHVFAYQRHCTGGGGNQLHNDQKEHSQRQQDRDAEGHFLTCHAEERKEKKKRHKKRQYHCWSYHSVKRVFIGEGRMWMMAIHTSTCVCIWSAIISPSIQSSN